MLVRMWSNWGSHMASGGCVNWHNHSGKLGVSTETESMAHSLPWYIQAHQNACAWMLHPWWSAHTSCVSSHGVVCVVFSRQVPPFSWVLSSLFSCCVCLLGQSCSILCDPRDCSLPGSSFHGILQARILEWVAMPFSRGSSQPRDQTQVFCIASGFFAS